MKPVFFFNLLERPFKSYYHSVCVCLQALTAPAMVIATNAGVDGSVVVEKTRELEWRSGYNAMSGRYEDLLNAGVADPCKVSRFALQNAVSVAGIVLTTQAVLVEKIKQPKPAVPEVPGIPTS